MSLKFRDFLFTSDHDVQITIVMVTNHSHHAFWFFVSRLQSVKIKTVFFHKLQLSVHDICSS